MSGSPPEPIFDALFQGHTRQTQTRAERGGVTRLLPWALALLIHLGLVALARQTEPSLESWSARVAALIHKELTDQAPVAVESLKLPTHPPPPSPEPAPVVEEPPPPPPSPPKAQPKPRARVPKAKKTRAQARRSSTPKSSPPPPAQAGKVVAIEVDPEAPLDMTGEVFVTGESTSYAGGVTTATGTSERFVETATLTPSPAPRPTSPTPSRAQSVSLSAGAWRCAWPARAMARDIYEQSVNLRVTVRKDGSVASAKVTRDPGDGFGEAAVSCALKTRFSPALNRAGEPIRAQSPPIKVRFTR